MTIEYLDDNNQWVKMEPHQVRPVSVLNEWDLLLLAVKAVEPEGMRDPLAEDCDTLMLFPTTIIQTIPDKNSLLADVTLLYKEEIEKNPWTEGKFRYRVKTRADSLLRAALG
jgi:hypothetical protein